MEVVERDRDPLRRAALDLPQEVGVRLSQVRPDLAQHSPGDFFARDVGELLELAVGEEYFLVLVEQQKSIAILQRLECALAVRLGRLPKPEVMDHEREEG